jgi:hypothetical protein
MRIIALEFKDAQAPVAEGILRFADLTILFGANDAGKTRLLSTIESAATLLESLSGGRHVPLPWARFFVQYSSEDLSDLVGFDALEEPPRETSRPSAPEWWREQDRASRNEYRTTRTFAFSGRSDRGSGDNHAPSLSVLWCQQLDPGNSVGRREVAVDLPLFPVPAHLPW